MPIKDENLLPWTLPNASGSEITTNGLSGMPPSAIVGEICSLYPLRGVGLGVGLTLGLLN